MSRLAGSLMFVAMLATLRAQPASIEGVAIDTMTRQPMAGVHITLRPVPTERIVFEGGDTYGAISRSDGHFSIASLPPALYLLTGQRNGYILLPPKTPTGRSNSSVTLTPGQQLTGFTLEMAPHAVIVGHVVDEFGDRVQRTQVQALPGPGTGELGFGTSPSDNTDDRGQFRIVLPPGKFYVQAMANREMGMDQYGPPEIRNDGLGPQVYGTTFYPGAVSKEKAATVELAAGQEATGIDIHLARSRSVTVSGVVTGMPDVSNRPAFPQVQLFPAEENPDQPAFPRFTQVAPDGSFAISGLTPGRYRLQARLQIFATGSQGTGSQGTGGQLQSAAVEVRSESADETNVSLALMAGEAVSGTVEFQGDPPHAAIAEKLTVRLEPDSRRGFFDGGEAKGAQVGEDGTFRVEQIFPGTLRIRVLPLPENAYVKSVSLGGVEAPDGVIDLSRGVRGADIKVTLSRNGGQLEGAVLRENGEPLREALALVFLAASAEEIGDRNMETVPAGAKFKYTGLRPGKYRIIALDGRQLSGDIAGVKALFGNAPEIEIHEGDRIEKDAEVMTPESPNAKQ